VCRYCKISDPINFLRGLYFRSGFIKILDDTALMGTLLIIFEIWTDEHFIKNSSCTICTLRHFLLQCSSSIFSNTSSQLGMLLMNSFLCKRNFNTISNASKNIPPDILDCPTRLSSKIIGISFILKPFRNVLYVPSI